MSDEPATQWTLGIPTEPGRYWVALVGYGTGPFLAQVRPAAPWFRNALLLDIHCFLVTTVQTSGVVAYVPLTPYNVFFRHPVWPPDIELPLRAFNPYVDRRATAPRLIGSPWPAWLGEGIWPGRTVRLAR